MAVLGDTGVGFLLRVLGTTFTAVALGLAVCAGLSVVFDDGAAAALGAPAAAVALLAGACARAAVRRPTGDPPLRAIFLAVTAGWLAASLVGAVPYLLAGAIEQPIPAFFESMSGFTSTGASTVEGRIDGVPDSLVIWRALTQWIGGLGFVVFVVAAAPGGTAAFQRVLAAEAPGPVTERRTPRMADTAKLLFAAYAVLTVAGFLAYLLAGMGAFDAAAHVLTTVSTGGFSSNPDSIGGFDSLAIELVAMALMVLGATNFALFTGLLVRSGPYRPQLVELGAMLGIIGGLAAGVWVTLIVSGDVDGVADALIAAAFQITSLGTTTGYTTAEFSAWNDSAQLAILWLMLIGGCAGSTAGGIKVVRAVLMGKIVWQGLRRQLDTARVAALRLGGRVYPETVREAILFFVVAYTGLYVAGTVVMAMFGLPFTSAMGTVAACMNTVGPAVGDVSYTEIPNGALLVLAAIMLAGRLEVLTVLVLLLPAFWRPRPR